MWLSVEFIHCGYRSCGDQLLQSQHFFFSFLTFYFVLGYSQLTMLWATHIPTGPPGGMAAGLPKHVFHVGSTLWRHL